jgi:hypothetical protein
MAIVIGRPGSTARAMERMPALGPFAYASLVAGTAYLVDALGGPRALLVPAAIAYLLGAIAHRPEVWRWLLSSGGRLGLSARRATWMSVALSTVRGISVGTVIGAVASRLLGAPPEGPVMVLVALSAVVLLPSLALRRAQREVARLGAGVRGEEDVAAVLGELPAGVAVIHDLRAGGAEIDHLVLHPRAGLIAIETKTWGGRLQAAGRTWRQTTRWGTRSHLAPDLQALRAAQALAAWLRTRGLGAPGLEEAIQPIVVVASRASFGGTPAVPVVPLRELAAYLAVMPGWWPYGEPPEEIARLIARHAGVAGL